MKIDFDYLNKIATQLHEAFVEDGGTEAYTTGQYVYSIQIKPESKRVEVHTRWPYFRDLVANESDCFATYSIISTMDRWMYWQCDIQAVHLVACLSKGDIVRELQELVSEHPESDYEICEDDDIENLFTTWQNMTGWNLKKGEHR